MNTLQIRISRIQKHTEHNFGNPILLYAAKLTEEELAHPRTAHFHEDIVEFVYLLKGSGEFEISGHIYSVEAGDLVIYNSSVVHNEGQKNQKIPLLCCAATGIQLPGLPPNCLFDDQMSPVLHLKEDGALFHHLMQTIYDEAITSTLRSAELCHALFLALLNLIINRIELEKPTYAKAQTRAGHISYNIRTYVDSNSVSCLTASQVAKHFDISESYLARIFKRSFGYSLTEYLVQRRIGEAQTLLLTTDLSIAEISQQVGYQNQSYFSKLFMQNVGLSPLRYRKLYRKSLTVKWCQEDRNVSNHSD